MPALIRRSTASGAASPHAYRKRGVVPGTGLEPVLPFGNLILSQKRLPFRHPGDGVGTLASPDGENEREECPPAAFRRMPPWRCLGTRRSALPVAPFARMAAGRSRTTKSFSPATRFAPEFTDSERALVGHGVAPALEGRECGKREGGNGGGSGGAVLPCGRNIGRCTPMNTDPDRRSIGRANRPR